jgi:hypothetical protein
MNRLGRAKALEKTKHVGAPKGPRGYPGTVQLPGGITLKAIPFVITAYNDDGSPRSFEIMPEGQDPTGDNGCVLFAQEQWIRGANRKHAKAEEPSIAGAALTGAPKMESFDGIGHAIAEPPKRDRQAMREAVERAIANPGMGVLASGTFTDDAE